MNCSCTVSNDSQSLDPEWIELIKNALELGISANDIQSFLRKEKII